jgi:hypothetical protein
MDEPYFSEPDLSEEAFNCLLDEMHVDELASIVLKGHLLIEEKLTEILAKNAIQAQYMESARLTFAQKLSVVRSMTKVHVDDFMWDMIGKLNALRNALSHSLDNSRRSSAISTLRDACVANFNEENREARRTMGELSLVTGLVIEALSFLESNQI